MNPQQKAQALYNRMLDALYEMGHQFHRDVLRDICAVTAELIYEPYLDPEDNDLDEVKKEMKNVY